MITDTKPVVEKWADPSVERPTKRASRSKRWALNWRLLVATVLLLVVGGPLVYFWHAYQVQRNASALLGLADGCESREEWRKAAENLHRYLQLRPSDVDAIVRMAEDFSKEAKLPLQKARVVQLYARAIALSPGRDDLPRRQMALRLEAGDYAAALKQAEELLKKKRDDAEALRVQAMALHHQWRSGRSVSDKKLLEAFQTAIDANPGNVDLASSLARLYRSELKPTEQDQAELDKLADEVMDRLVADSNQSAKALVARYLYRRQIANEPKTPFDSSAAEKLQAAASADLDAAMSADTTKEVFEIWWLAGSRAEAAGEYDTAIEYFRDAVKSDKNDRRGHLALGNAYGRKGEDEPAIEAWRAGLKASPDDFEMQLLIASAEVRQGRWDRASADLKVLEKKLAPMTGPQAAAILSSVCLLRGDVAVGQKEFAAALLPLKQALVLREAGARSATRALLIGRVEERLGQCYSALGQWDQAALAFQRLAELLPHEPGPRLQAAAAWEYLGRFDEALRQYDAVLMLKGVTSGAWVAAANAEYRHQAAQRDWQAVANRVARAREALAKENLPEPPLLTIVEAEYDAEQGLVEKSVERCHAVEAAALVNKELVRRLIFDYERWHRTGDADRLLQQFGTTKNARLDYLLLASQLLLHRNQDDEAYRVITEALADADGDLRRALEYRLAVMYVSDGKLDQAKPLLESIADADKNDLRPLQFLAEVALQSGEVDKPIPYDRVLESREGPDGTNWRYYRAQRLLNQANEVGASDPAAAAGLYEQAAELQKQIESLRPAWAQGYLLKAKLAESRPSKTGKGVVSYDEAIQAYTQAVRLEPRNIPVYDALINLLHRAGRIVEAELYIDRRRDLGPLSDQLSTIAMMVDARRGKLDRAISLARERVAAEGNDAMWHLRLGLLLADEARSAKSADPQKLTEAEEELKRSRELAPADSRTWSALLSFYLRGKNTDAARALLTEVEHTKPFKEEETPFFLAQGYTFLGDDEQAAAHYRQALEAAPDRAAVRLLAANYFLKRDPPLAEKCLRRALEIDPSNRDAARVLAELLVKRSGTEEEVERLLTQGEIQPQDRRLYALVLLRRGGQDERRQAQQILEALAGDAKEVESIDRLLLARLYEAQAALAAARGDSKSAETTRAAAREQLKTLVSVERPAPEHLAAYVDNLLRSGRSADAKSDNLLRSGRKDEAQAERVIAQGARSSALQRLNELAKLEPETSNLRTLSLRLQYLKDVQDERSTRPLIDSYVDNRLQAVTEKSARARVLQAAAELYSTYELTEQAENALRRASELDASATGGLVNWLVKRDRTSEAVQLCVELAQQDATPLPAMLLSNALALGKPSEDDLRAAEDVIERALKDHGNDPNLLFAISVKELMEGNNDESIGLLRKVLKLQPRHIPAMNNLAFLLSMRPDSRNEAADWMAKVLALAGGAAELVDSKGWVLMQQQKLTEAVEAFQQAVTGAPTDPRYHFHLALAYQLQGKVEDARNAFQTARQNKIDSATMPPDERSALARLETALQ